MFTETNGIVLRQTKTLENRRMLVLLSDKYGKISAGSSISEKGKRKNALAIRPFCRGHYELNKNRDSYNIVSTEVLESYYAIGENVDKYIAASFILELTDAFLGENEPQPQIFSLLCDYLYLMTKRTQAFQTLSIAYQLKALQFLGSGLDVKTCRRCQKPCQEKIAYLSVSDGGLLCSSCIKQEDLISPLIFSVDYDVINAINYILTHPFRNLENLALIPEYEEKLNKFLLSYRSYHLGIDHLKSDNFQI